MSDQVNPQDVTLNDIFTDGLLSEKQTTVYDNGKMQAVVWPAVTYRGSLSVEKVKEYVQKNVDVCYTSGTQIKKVEWTQSFESNEYAHDVKKGPQPTRSVEAKYGGTEVRVPFYYTVKKDTEGEQKWVARLGDQVTSLESTVIIKIQRYTHADKDDVEIIDWKYYKDEDITIRVMRYKPGAKKVPLGHKLIKYIGKDGLRLSNAEGNGSWCANTWLPMIRIDKEDSSKKKAIGAFVDYKCDYIKISGKNTPWYNDDEFLCDTRIGAYENGNKGQYVQVFPLILQIAPTSEIENAWKEGIVMALSKTFYIFGMKTAEGPPFTMTYYIKDPVKVEDNYGNEFDVLINWNAEEEKEDEDYFKHWAIDEFDLIN